MAKYDAQGREIPDPTPVSVPGGFVRPLSIQEEIRRAIRGELSRQAAEDGLETFEEADDFDVDEEGDPLSPYEIPEGAPERAVGPPETLDGVQEPVQEKIALEPATQAAEASPPSTDSGTATPPAGRSSRS